jgi:flavorubredoxin
MFDTGYQPDWGVIEDSLDAILGDATVDYVVVSHPEEPHAGNLGRILLKYPDAVAVGDVRDYHLYYPEVADRLQTREIGESIDLGGGHEFFFARAVIRDLPNTVWGYEKKTQTMFTSDGFIFAHHRAAPEAEMPVHEPGECARFSEELTMPPTAELAAINTSSGLYWTRYHDASVVFDELDEQLESLPTRMFAPTHGNVVVGDLADIKRVVKAGLRSSYRGASGSPRVADDSKQSASS